MLPSSVRAELGLEPGTPMLLSTEEDGSLRLRPYRAVAAQGRGHGREAVRPVPFRGAADVAVRIVVEQWVTFPRFVLSGGFARAWTASLASPTANRSHG